MSAQARGQGTDTGRSALRGRGSAAAAEFRPARSGGRVRGDGGAVFAEFALVVPFILLLATGVIEYGLAFRESNDLERTVSIAARTGATQGTAPFTDYDILQAVRSGLLGQDRSELRRVIVYRATAADGAVPANCLAVVPTGSAAGVSGSCNVYSAAQAAQTNPGVGFRRGSVANPTCVAGSWDSRWCPITRDQDQPGVDRVGVFVEVQYRSMTGLLPTTITIGRRAVFEIEPEVDF